MNLPDPSALVQVDAAIPGGFLSHLLASGYGPDSINAVDSQVPTVLGAGRLPLIEAVLADGLPGAAALALFCYQIDVPIAEAERALGLEVISACRTHGVLVEKGGGLHSPWRIVPFLDVMVVSDWPDAGTDAVMGPGPTTMYLAEAALPAAGARVLDLGCGAGSLALAAKRAGAGEVVAVDINPRAVAMARINAQLNRLEVDCRCGDMLAPVAMERFDLIVSQPPYVVLPTGQQGVTFLHGGIRGDELARRVLAEVPAALRAGGVAMIHFDGPADRESNMVDELARAANAQVDIAILSNRGLSPMVQAMSYATLLHGGFGTGYAEAVLSYLDHCKSTGLKAFGRYLVVLRRGALGWGIRLPASAIHRPDRAGIDTLIAGLDLACADDAVLLQRCIRPPPYAELELHRPFGSPEVQRIATNYTGGLWPNHDISEQTGALCDLLAGSATVGEAISSYAAACELTGEEAQRQVLGFVRDGLRRGVLVDLPKS